MVWLPNANLLLSWQLYNELRGICCSVSSQMHTGELSHKRPLPHQLMSLAAPPRLSPFSRSAVTAGNRDPKQSFSALQLPQPVHE